MCCHGQSSGASRMTLGRRRIPSDSVPETAGRTDVPPRLTALNPGSYPRTLLDRTIAGQQGGLVSKPLAGVTVVDLTHALSGPFCTHQLQLPGPDALKVEAPGADDHFRARPGVVPAINAGKRSMTLNIKSPDGFEILGRLLDGAGVLVENYRPGVAAKLGLTWERL